MTIYKFNGRPFCLKNEHLLQREQRIFEQLVKDCSTLKKVEWI